MDRKPNLDFNYICEKCGHQNSVDKEKSNNNFTVIPSKCEECGGRMKFKFNNQDTKILERTDNG